MDSLNIEIIDAACKQVTAFEEQQEIAVRIKLNPRTWKRATDTMKALSGIANIPIATCLGIPVFVDPELPEDTMIFYYSGEKYTVIKYLGEG